MADYQKLGHDIVCIDTAQHRPRLAAAYLLRGADEYAFIECGTGHSLSRLLGTLEALGVGREQVAYVMPTHVHLDHAGGAGVLMRALPRARLVAHPRAARHLIDPRKLIEGAAAVYGTENMQRLYGEIAPVAEDRVLIAEDGFELRLGDRPLRFLDAPGHARHHYAIWDERSRGFFTGDVFGISYRDFDGGERPFLLPTTTPVQFEPEAWNATLDRLLALRPQAMYLTHYGRVTDVATLARDLRRGLAAYVAIARDLASAPDRHARLVEALMRHHLAELAVLDSPVSEARARQLLAMDMELNAQGLEVWLARQAKAAASA